MSEAYLTHEDELRLVEVAERFFFDPYGFVLWAFPWGEPGSPLEVGTDLQDAPGPDDWQVEVLQTLGRECFSMADVIQIACASGHGPGKTALVAWIIQWFEATRPFGQCVVTANTKEQLTGKTWRELEKWRKMSIIGDLFSWTATTFKLKAEPETWFAHAVPWSKSNSQAFAGTHEKYVLMIFDEASTIDDEIWEVADGAMTTKGAIWIAFGNPTKNTGRFRRCFRPQSSWIKYRVNSENSRIATNKALFKQWEQEWGRDSDFYRVRVLGEFPNVAAEQFIPNSLVEAAQQRKVEEWMIDRNTPVLMGIDVGRQGDDPSVFRFRKGPKLYEHVQRYRVADLMRVASHAALALRDGVVLDGVKHQVDMAFVDAVGLGAGVYDRLIQLGHNNVIPVFAGDKAYDDKTYKNIRAEMWGRMKAWLGTADLPKDDTLYEELIAPEYYFTERMQIQIEKKEDIKVRLGHSTDDSDALALTFAEPVPSKLDMGTNPDDYEPENP